MSPNKSSAGKVAARAKLALLKTPLKLFLQLSAYLLFDFPLHQYSAVLRDSGYRVWAMQQQHIAGFQNKPAWELPLCYLSHLIDHHCQVLRLRLPFLYKKGEIKMTEYFCWARSITFQILCTITKRQGAEKQPHRTSTAWRKMVSYSSNPPQHIAYLLKS